MCELLLDHLVLLLLVCHSYDAFLTMNAGQYSNNVEAKVLSWDTPCSMSISLGQVVCAHRYEFQMQFGSIGWSVGATLGYAQALKGKKRVIASIGDGSFQVTAQVSATKHDLDKIICSLLACGSKNRLNATAGCVHYDQVSAEPHHLPDQ